MTLFVEVLFKQIATKLILNGLYKNFWNLYYCSLSLSLSQEYYISCGDL